jgi:TetR/AcrR family transcriptional regulator
MVKANGQLRVTMTRDDGTEERILEAARAVFLRRGMAGARMQEIADEAGVNKALLHYYFRSKEKLALAVFRSAAAQIIPRIYAILGSPEALEEKVRAVIAVELEFLERHPYFPGYVVSEIHYHPDLVRQVFGERGAPPLDVLREQLREQIAAGRMRPIGIDQFMVNLMSLLLFPFVARPVFAFLLNLEGGRFDDFIEDRKATLADFFLRGLRP